MEDFLRIGVITTTHGIHGEVKVFPTTDSAERFLEVKDVILQKENKKINTQITEVRFFKNLAIVKFECFGSPEEARLYSQADVMIARKDAQPLEEGEYYIADLIGCTVFDEEKNVLGILKDVLQTGANDVYIVETGKKNEKGQPEELLIPVIKQCILNVDIEKNEILVRLLPGL